MEKHREAMKKQLKSIETRQLESIQKASRKRWQITGKQLNSNGKALKKRWRKATQKQWKSIRKTIGSYNI